MNIDRVVEISRARDVDEHCADAVPQTAWIEINNMGQGEFARAAAEMLLDRVEVNKFKEAIADVSEYRDNYDDRGRGYQSLCQKVVDQMMESAEIYFS